MTKVAIRNRELYVIAHKAGSAILVNIVLNELLSEEEKVVVPVLYFGLWVFTRASPLTT